MFGGNLKNINGVEEEKIHEFEGKIHKKFPGDSRTFLQKRNGGHPKEMLVTPSFEEINPDNNEHYMQGTDIDQFLSLKEIEFTYNDFLDDGYIPNNFVPFAVSSFGNYLLLNLEMSDDYGAVFFSDHDLFDSKKEQYTISKVSSSFSEFINQLFVLK